MALERKLENPKTFKPRKGDFKSCFQCSNILGVLWGFGFIDVKANINTEKGKNYLSKYLIKELEKNNLLKNKNNKYYNFSKNCKNPIIISIPINNIKNNFLEIEKKLINISKYYKNIFINEINKLISIFFIKKENKINLLSKIITLNNEFSTIKVDDIKEQEKNKIKFENNKKNIYELILL